MARLLGPDANSRLVYRSVAGNLKSAAGSTATVYADAAGTTLADIATYDPNTPGTPGATVAGSQLAVDVYSQIPLFWFPDSVDTVYITVDGGPLTTYRADSDSRLDALATADATEAATRAAADGAEATARAAADSAEATARATGDTTTLATARGVSLVNAIIFGG